MEIKKIKEFLQAYGLKREEFAEATNYTRQTMTNILNKKVLVEGRMRVAFMVGMKNLLEKKKELYEKGLEDWDKYCKEC